MRDTNIADKEIVHLGEITSRRNSDIPINDIYSISLLKSNSLIELQGVKVGMQDADAAKSNLISAHARSSFTIFSTSHQLQYRSLPNLGGIMATKTIATRLPPRLGTKQIFL
jgi:hypothetical protein